MSYVKLDKHIYYGIHPSIVKPDLDVDHFIDLTEPHEFPNYEPPENTIHFPIKDRGAPSLEDLTKIIKKLQRLNGVLYIYCKGGHGRSGTISTCLYGAKNNLDSSKALKYVLKEWKNQRDMSKINPRIRSLGSPQTRIQKTRVKEFLDGSVKENLSKSIELTLKEVDIASYIDKIKGMIYCHAYGDALGAPHEFRYQKKNYDGILHHPIIMISRWQPKKTIKAGTVTDDTRMAAALIKSMQDVDNNVLVYNKDKAAMEYMKWCNSEPFAIGRNTRSLFKGVKTLNGYKKRYEKRFLEPTSEPPSESNGSLMRTYPLALLPKEKIEKACEEDTSLTNPNDVNHYCSLIYNLLLRRILEGKIKSLNIKFLKGYLKDEKVPEKVRKVIDQALSKKYRNIREVGKGWVLHAFYISLYSYIHIKSIENMMKWIIDQEGDTDTNAAIAGALKGAQVGYEKIYKKHKSNIDILEEVNPEIKEMLTLINFI